MCGINGFLRYGEPDTNKDPISLINKMNNLIHHRGPDDEGFYVDHCDTYHTALGMRRLAIIDLESGQQPMYSDDKKVVLVFNGEIYNYPQLRSELSERGVKFHTKSDTEVILQTYLQKGVAGFKDLDGMFAFSIYDKRKGKVYIARDFFGEKPLHYTLNDNGLYWASELKSLCSSIGFKPGISLLGLNQYFRLTYIPAPNTIYENIYKLEANHYLEFDIPTKDLSIHPISEEFGAYTTNLSFNQAKERTRELVQNSVASRSIADVPIGTFLSGGVDSSIISLCLSRLSDKKINTFSIGFKKKEWGETDKSRLVANLIGSKHHEYIIGEDDLKDSIDEILLNFDEPFSDSASLPTYLVAKKTSDSLKVALTGDGGDEIFGGYSKYLIGNINARYTSLVPRNLHSLILKGAQSVLKVRDDNRGKRFKIKKALNSIDYENEHYWSIISLANNEENLRKLLKDTSYYSSPFKYYKKKLNLEKPTSLREFRFVDKLLSLEGGMLPKVDRTSMLTSLECRAPFLNKELWEFTNSLPQDYLLKGNNKKFLLKESFKNDFPKDFLDKSKQGFGSPVGDWLRSGLQKELESYLDSSFLESQGIFNTDVIRSLVNNHLNRKEDNTFSVWAFYCFQKWYCNTYMQL